MNYTEALIAAHRGATAPAPANGLPADLVAGATVQREVARALGATVAGWKVGFSPDGVPVAGPLYAAVVQPSGGERALTPRGFIVEIELAFRLARDLAPGRWMRDDILAAAGEALIGIELICGRFGEPPTAPFPAFFADNLGNAGYVIGAATRDFRSLDLKALHCRFEVDGEVVQEHAGGHPQGDPVEPLRAYAERPIDALGGVKAGQIVTTGSLTKPLRLARPARIRATLAGIGDAVLTLRAA